MQNVILCWSKMRGKSVTKDILPLGKFEYALYIR